MARGMLLAFEKRMRLKQLESELMISISLVGSGASHIQSMNSSELRY
jgi:hypothetical protein